MNKKLVAIIVAVVIVIVAIVGVIIGTGDKNPTYSGDGANTTEENSSSNKDNTNDNYIDVKPSDDNNEVNSNENEPSSNDKDEPSTDKKDEPSTNGTSNNKPPVNNNDNDNEDEPATCQYCGSELRPTYNTGEFEVGEFCDGNCQGWLG